MLAAGATKGKNLFEGLKLTTQYFFDAVGARFEGSLNYRQIEGPKDMENHPTAVAEVKDAVHTLLEPLIHRRKVLFACRENACRSQMASAFAQFYGGDKMDVLNGGSQPAEKINPVMVEAMHEKGIDMAFRIPKSIEAAIDQSAPQVIITMGCGEACPLVPGARKIDWDLPDPAGQPIEFMRSVRDDIEKRVQDFITAIV
jgi:protein-tyrosine-phosphatase